MRLLLCVGLVLACAESAAEAAIVIDGVANEPEWATATTAVNTVTSNWTTANRLDRLRAFTDANYLYIAVDGTISGNAIILYVDSKPGGVSDIAGLLADNFGAVDNALSSSLVANAQFGAEFGWGTLDMNRSTSVGDDRMGWRDIVTSLTNFYWQFGDECPTACSANVCETKMPLATLGGSGDIRLFLRLCDPTGAYFANQNLPMDNPLNPQTVSVWMSVPRRAPTDVPGAMQSGLHLYPNHPNPFNPMTTIRFDLPVAGQVRLAVYDVAGRLVKVLVEGERAAGSYEAVWDGRDASGHAAPSGGYLARLVAGGKSEGVRLSLVR